ncbi:hypothetical protein [Sorangium cellulosum]|uniref:Uncharacterized protein n=2 Tax=Sorangium cellulosum TaxID=56 RepID=A0A150TKU3_SORCE|nr:hypothetical protein [Sorangium cellulosum]AGP36115.1 hypothetical protein SCE1572_17370 [Sorangium cellulosum So0157-2]KYG05294.1 hypothetical protein BE21_41650 [Sorangium cellulosum]
MSRGRRLALAALAALACGGCGEVDEIVIAISTDLAVPKDFDVLQVQVFEGNQGKFNRPYRRLGGSDAEAQLPATLGFFSSDAGGESIRIKVAARNKDDVGPVRILREVVTTIPKDRVALLTVSLDFLCDGSGQAAGSDVERALCDEGQTCVAGACVSSEIDSSTLPDYSSRDVFGGGDGECFDVTTCFADATPAEVDTAGCTIAGDGAALRNVALETAGDDGICDGDEGDEDRRCLVALNADSDSGFRVGDDGRIQLPPAVCEQMAQKKIAAVLTAPATSCVQKTAGLPTCGPWLASRSEEP